MKKIFSILCAIALVVGFTACSSEQDIPYEELNNQQVYFPNTISTTVELSPEATTFEIPVMRMGTDAVTIPLIVTMGEENPADLQFPASVAFAEGKKETSIVVSYDPTKVEPGYYNDVNISFGPDYNTPYGYSAVALKVGQAEPWVSLGLATITDNWVFGSEAKVEILQNQLYPNRFRVLNPFTEIALSAGAEPNGTFTEALDITVLKAGDVYRGVTVTQDDIIVFNDCNTGYPYDETHDIWMLHPSEFSSMSKDDSAWGNCRVVDYQENGLPTQFAFGPMFYAQDDSGAGIGGWNETKATDDIVITFPGVVIADYSAEVTYSGKFEHADGGISVEAAVELGDDVASAIATVVPGRDPSEGISGIINGTQGNVTEFSKSGDVRVAMPEEAESGVYSFVVVTYDAAGEAQDYGYTKFNYSASGDVVETWSLAFYGTYEYKSVFANADGSPYYDEGLEFYISDLNENRMKISNVFYGVDFIFEMDDDGNITFEDQYTGYTDAKDGDLMVCDMNALNPGNFPTVSYYQNGVFYLNTGYYANDGFWGYDDSDNNDNLETFTLTAEAGSKPANAPKKGASRKHSPKKAVKGIMPVDKTIRK